MSTKKTTPKSSRQSRRKEIYQELQAEVVSNLRGACARKQDEIERLRTEKVQLEQRLDSEMRNLTAERNFWFHLANDFRFHYTHSVVNAGGYDECRRFEPTGAGVRQAIKDLLLAPSEPDSKIARNSRRDDKARRAGYGIALEQFTEVDHPVDRIGCEYGEGTAAEQEQIPAAILKKREPARIVNASKAV